jgi:DNA-binding transcriptional MocR family regulator
MFKPITRSWPTHIYKHIIYCVPSFSNPTGRCMTLSCREDLVLLAREFDALIISDDVYDFLWWPAAATDTAPPFRAILPRLVDIDRALPGTTPFGNALSNGSFSKICAPGVRTGWVEAAPALAHAASQAGSSRSGGAPSGLAASLLAAAAHAGDLRRHVEGALRPAYARRWAVMCAAVEEHLVPLGASLPFARVDVPALYDLRRGGGESGPEFADPAGLPPAVAGGYFIWVQLPSGIGATALATRAEAAQGVIVQTEGMCLVPIVAGTSRAAAEMPGGEGDRHVRLCFAWEDERLLVDGVRKLASVLKQMLEGDRGPVGDTGDRSSSRYS